MAENFANNAYSYLQAPITAGATTLTVLNAANFPSPDFRIVVDNEYMLVTGVSGNQLTVTRGIEGSTAVSHEVGDEVVHVITAGSIAALASELGDLTSINEDIDDLQTDVTALQSDVAAIETSLATGAAIGAKTGTSYTVLDADVGTYMRFTNASAKAVTFPSTLPMGEYHVRNVGAADLTLTAGGGVTLNASSGGTLVMATLMSATVKKVGAAEFDVFGQTKP